MVTSAWFATKLGFRCTVVDNYVQDGAPLPRTTFVIYHGDKDPYAEQVDDIIGCMLKKGLRLKSYLVPGCGHGDLPACMGSAVEYTCYVSDINTAINAQLQR